MGAIPVLSLFSGSGGLDLGFEGAGYKSLLALDVDSAAIETYNLNKSDTPGPARQADLSEIDPGQIATWWEQAAGPGVSPDGVIGGPPCQAFSVSNVHKLEEDPRARLPLAYARILKCLNRRFAIRFFVFENVAGLGHRPHDSSLQTFIDEFEAAGFGVQSFYLDAVRFGVPQYRNRMFIVGFKTGDYDAARFLPPAGDDDVRTVRQTLRDLPEPAFFSRSRKPLDMGLHPNHWCMNPRSEKFRNGTLRAGEMPGRSFRMLDWDAPSWTVAYGHREVHVHPTGRRRLSVYEAMLLQGFPSDYELSGTLSDQIRLVSDAVPPPLALALASAIREFTEFEVEDSEAYAQEGESGHSEQLGFPELQTAAPKSTKA